MLSTIKRALARRRDTVQYKIPTRRRPTTPLAQCIKLAKRQARALKELKEAGKYGPDVHSQ